MEPPANPHLSTNLGTASDGRATSDSPGKRGLKGGDPVIEGKINAGEGARQTERYAEPKARAKLCSQLDLDAPEASQRNFFLTLDDTPPRFSWFKPIKWTVVAEAAEASTHPDTVHRDLVRIIRIMAAAADGWMQQRAHLT